MPNPTDRNDPQYSNDPNMVWSGGRWQYRGTPNAAPTTNVTHVSATNTGTGTGDWGAGIARGFESFGKYFEGKDPNAALYGTQAAGRVNPTTMFAEWDRKMREQAARPAFQNPYNTAVADQTRAGQLALMQQMQQQMNGPSLAGLQGQRGLAQSGQQALMNAAVTGNGRGAMLQAQNTGAGLAMDVGQARLAEAMRAQAGIGAAAGNLRGADQRSAEAQLGFAQQANNINASNARFSLQNGQAMTDAQLRNALEAYKFARRVEEDKNARARKERDNLLAMLAAGSSMVSTFAGYGGNSSASANTGNSASTATHSTPSSDHG